MTDKADKKGCHIYCLCEFDDGAIIESSFSNIRSGNVRSPNYKSVCGIGYIGQGTWDTSVNGIQTKEYTLWSNMIKRCYSEKMHRNIPTYKDVVVCNRWHCFQNFCEDIVNINGYEHWKQCSNYELDKDIICERDKISPKIYSEKTCMFVSHNENMTEKNKRTSITGKTYLAISPMGKQFEFTNIREFSECHNLYNTHVGSCLQGKASHHKGWTFKIKE